MSIADSIFAGVGRPDFSSSHLRVPVRGPFNTLVIVHLAGASLYPGVTINTGKMVRSQLRIASDFVLAGFDQRDMPPFVHSTTGFLSYIASSDDATFTYAIDAVSASFDEVGRYYVGYDAATLNIKEVTSASVSLTSWVLVNEPPLQPSSEPFRTLPRTLLTGLPSLGLPLSLFGAETSVAAKPGCSRIEGVRADDASPRE